MAICFKLIVKDLFVKADPAPLNSVDKGVDPKKPEAWKKGIPARAKQLHRGDTQIFPAFKPGQNPISRFLKVP